VTKKGPGSRDSRSEPDAEGASSENFRVDRVFAPTRPQTPTQRPSSNLMQRPAATTPPHKPPTNPPPLASGTTPVPSTTETETELALRRQLSRLQRQLSDAQRELANKDDEVAAAVEKRFEIQAAYETAMEQQRLIQTTLDDASAFRSQMQGIEERLAQVVAEASELRLQLDRERTERATMAVQFDEEKAAFERARSLWRDETKTIDEEHASQLAQLDQQKRTAVEAAEAALAGQLERQKEAHTAELEALREAHERALAALRGELEPEVAKARNFSAEIERLESELQAQAAEHQNLLAERIELHKWEQQQQAETHADELAAQARTHAAEVARLKDEVVAANEAGKLIERNATLREQLWEQTVSSLRESQKKLQTEVAAAREKMAQADAAKAALEERTATATEAVERLHVQVRELEGRLSATEEEARRTTLDRQRFAAYLEEGLAMLGAVPPHDFSTANTAPAMTPPKRPSVPSRPSSPAIPIEDEEAREMEADYEGEPSQEATTRATRRMDAIDASDLDLEPEAEPLPDPTRPPSA
jgi:chromosome segregation ATPase